jgi:hypothetical protein
MHESNLFSGLPSRKYHSNGWRKPLKRVRDPFFGEPWTLSVALRVQCKNAFDLCHRK